MIGPLLPCKDLTNWRWLSCSPPRLTLHKELQPYTNFSSSPLSLDMSLLTRETPLLPEQEKPLVLSPSTQYKNPDPYATFPKTASPGRDSSESEVYTISSKTTVPPRHSRRTVVLCFDGTGMFFQLTFFS